MTEKEMTIEEALELAVTALIDVASTWPGSTVEFFQSVDVLRKIGKPVERSEAVEHFQCQACMRMSKFCVCEKHAMIDRKFMDSKLVKYNKRWTETPVLKPVIQTSKPVYEPVDTKNEGGRDE